MARDLLHVYSSDDGASRRIVVDLRVHERTTELIAAAADLRDDPDRVSVEAVTLRRGLARRLAAEGFGRQPPVAYRALEFLVQHGLAHRHVGSLHAPDAEMAINNARDVYTRRNEGVSIWAVKSTDIAASSPGQKGPLFDPANSKVYRHPTFYEIPEELGHM